MTKDSSIVDAIKAARDEGYRSGIARSIALCRFYEAENFRLASDTIRIDPILCGERSPVAVDLSDDLQVQGCIHAAMAHAARNIADLLEAEPGAWMP